MNIDLQEFTDIYNQFTDNKINLGGGMVTVNELLSNVKFVENENNIKYENKYNDKKGGTLKNDLLTFVSKLDDSKKQKGGNKKSLFKKNKKGGGENLAKNPTLGNTEDTGAASNFFYVTKPTHEYTNVNNLVDMKSNIFEYPPTQGMQRSFVF